MSVVLCGAFVFSILWTLAFYPVWLAYKAKRAGHPVICGPFEPAITAVIPVHNGERFLAAKLESVLASDYPADKLDILVLSDASSDQTDAIAEGYVASGRVRFMRLPRGGKAAALTQAWEHVEREVILLTDVRQALERDCVRLLVSRLHDSSVGAVSGSLKIRQGETSGEGSTGLYWRYESWIRHNLSRIDSILGATGPIYAVRRSLVRPLPKGCILDDVWLPFQVVLAGKRAVLAEDAVAWDYPTSLNSEFRRKVRTQAGIYQLFRQEPRLLNPRKNRLFWPFIMLKLGRLLLPHLLIATLIMSVFLPSPLNLIGLSLQALFYSMYFVDTALPEGSPLKRISAPIAAFIVLVTAAFFAQSIFFNDPATLWKTTQVRVVKAPE
ncbi:MAG: glycosyltransferase family 2 protein [bacterium]